MLEWPHSEGSDFTASAHSGSPAREASDTCWRAVLEDRRVGEGDWLGYLYLPVEETPT